MKRFLVVFLIITISFASVPVLAISEGQEGIIQKQCKAIKVNLRAVQREDAKVRIRLGAYYDTVLTKYIMPLNVKLVENNLSNAKFIDNQNEFADTKTVFVKDFTKYQQMLEELVAVDCEAEPEKFYDELVDVRQRRKTMEQDVLKMRRLISEHIKLVEDLKGKL
ncbi:hypothetical protein IJG89_02000 [Candidatus Saccharibacteria bacterium]|nr:hypothetical protein [Candidatus Saccharibacteria bacterium]